MITYQNCSFKIPINAGINKETNKEKIQNLNGAKHITLQTN
jgi:hypothetical protein